MKPVFDAVRLKLALWLLAGIRTELPCCFVRGGVALTIEQDFSREELFKQRLQAYLPEVPENEKPLLRREARRLDVILD